MVKGLWNYAIKVADTERATRFYVDVLGAEVRLQGEVLGCVYTITSSQAWLTEQSVVSSRLSPCRTRKI